MRRPRLEIAAVVGVVLACLVGGVLFIEGVPRDARLPGLTAGLRSRIVRFAQETGRSPESLAALAIADPPSAQFIADPWGQDFQYAALPDGVVTLTSLSGHATIGEAAKNDTLRVWRFRLREAKSAGNDPVFGDANEGWIGNDRWGKPKAVITQSK